MISIIHRKCLNDLFHRPVELQDISVCVMQSETIIICNFQYAIALQQIFLRKIDHYVLSRNCLCILHLCMC